MLSDSVMIVGILAGTMLTAVIMGLKTWFSIHQIDVLLHRVNSLQTQISKLKYDTKKPIERVSPIGDILEDLGIDIQSPFVRGMIQSLVKKSGILDKLQGKDTAIDEKNIYFEGQ